MIKLISAVVAGVVGAGLAALTAWGVVSSNTAAPASNPARQQIVNYGDK